MTMLPEVVVAVPLPDFKLRLQLATGETRLFDVRPYISADTVFGPLGDVAPLTRPTLSSARSWSGDVDIAPRNSFPQINPALKEERPAQLCAGLSQKATLVKSDLMILQRRLMAAPIQPGR